MYDPLTDKWCAPFIRHGGKVVFMEGRWRVMTYPDTYVTDENGETCGVDIDTRAMPKDENTLTPDKSWTPEKF